MGGPVVSSARAAVPINLAADTPANFMALYVGTTGDIKVDTLGGSPGVIFKTVPVGMFPVAVSKVYSTANGTTAANLVGLAW